MDLASAHAVTVRGAGETTVLLAHGLGGSQAQWEPVAARLAEHTRVVTFDLAGSGDADPSLFSPVRHASIVGFADDLAMLCAELGLRDVVYVGHSMSGMAGALAVAADPGLWSRLVLLNASACYVDDPEHGYVGGFSAEEVDGLLSAIAADFGLWAAGFAGHVMGNADRPDLTREFAASLAAYGPEVALTVFRAAFESDHRDVLPLVEVPTLVLSTTADPAVPTEATRFLGEAIPDAEVQVLDVEGHFPHVVAPELIWPQVERFLGAAR
jgi:sigma-B regulation protein RsbQ